MNDRVPGSCWHNPVWYGKWRIYVSDMDPNLPYEYVHDDYDGAEDAGDSRCGYGVSIEDCKSQIDDHENN